MMPGMPPKRPLSATRSRQSQAAFRRPGHRVIALYMSGPKEKDAGTSRDKRRAKALRENLKRRKAQAKGRAQSEETHGESGDSRKDSSHSARARDE